MILVTGRAGFIGSNFISDWLSQSNEPVLNLDNLTYTGSCKNIASLDGNSGHIFVHGDIGDSELISSLLRKPSPVQSSISLPKAMSTAPSTARKTSSRLP